DLEGDALGDVEHLEGLAGRPLSGGALGAVGHDGAVGAHSSAVEGRGEELAVAPVARAADEGERCLPEEGGGGGEAEGLEGDVVGGEDGAGGLWIAGDDDGAEDAGDLKGVAVLAPGLEDPLGGVLKGLEEGDGVE